MTLSIQPQHLRRYRDVVALLVKYGRSDLVKQAGLDRALDGDTAEHAVPEDEAALAAELATDLERLGPTYVKLGQLLSTRADLVPEAYMRVEAIDERALISVVGAAMLMRVETSHRILGYPALAIIFFLLAAGGGVALLVTILIADRRRRHH